MNTELSRTFKLVTVWLLLGGAVFIGVQWFGARQQQTRFTLDNGTIELRRAPDGHFHWPGEVNGIAVHFLVDTGATSTALPSALAERAGLEIDGSIRSSTAGGVVRGGLARADVRLQGGVGADGLRVAVLAGLEAPLLGMDILSKLHFSQQAGVLRIQAKPSP